MHLEKASERYRDSNMGKVTTSPSLKDGGLTIRLFCPVFKGWKNGGC